MHSLTRSSLRLNSVKVNYSGILGMFPNLLIMDVGASGDGKSIGLWMDTQCMHYLRITILKARMTEWEKAKKKYEVRRIQI